jgi:hypothetical protein
MIVGMWLKPAVDAPLTSAGYASMGSEPITTIERTEGMIAEPQRVAGSGGARERLRLLGAIAIPPILLVAIVGAAVVGAPAQPLATVRPNVQPSPEATPGALVAPVEFPTEALGLRVVDVATALDRSGNRTDTVLAVRGYLRMLSPSPACGPVTPFDQTWAAFAAEQGFVSSAATYCERHAVLRPRAETEASRPMPRLNVNITVGAVVPEVPASVSGSEIPVVVIGRLSANADACAFINGCERRFDVDRLVWVSGLWRGPTTSVEPSMQGDGPRLASRIRDRLASAVTAPSDPLLLETLVQAATLRQVDPRAAAIVAPDDSASRIWYRRSLDTTSGPIASIRWVALDDAAGTLLAHGLVTP